MTGAAAICGLKTGFPGEHTIGVDLSTQALYHLATKMQYNLFGLFFFHTFSGQRNIFKTEKLLCFA